MQEFFADRPGQVEQAARAEFDRIGSQSPAPSTLGPQARDLSNNTLNDVRGQINQASEPFYQAAEGIRLTPAEMTHVRSIPGWTEARDAVRNNPQINWRVAHLPDDSISRPVALRPSRSRAHARRRPADYQARLPQNRYHELLKTRT